MAAIERERWQDELFLMHLIVPFVRNRIESCHVLLLPSGHVADCFSLAGMPIGLFGLVVFEEFDMETKLIGN